MMEYKINQLVPCSGVPVLITTNWATYEAIRTKSDFDGYEFVTLDSSKKVQETVVKQWSFIH